MNYHRVAMTNAAVYIPLCGPGEEAVGLSRTVLGA